MATMWLDRLSSIQGTIATSTHTSRSYTPHSNNNSHAPFNYQQSNNHSGMASPLSGADSPSSFVNPIETLNALFGTDDVDGGPSDDDDTHDNSIQPGLLDEDRPIVDDDYELEFDFQGRSLHSLASTSHSSIIAHAPEQSIEDFISFKTRIDELHMSIYNCDEVLDTVEHHLTQFQNDLASVSADIEILQERSSHLNVRLNNRRAVDRLIGPVIVDLSIAPAIVTKIIEGSLDDAWVKAVTDIDRKWKSLSNAPEETDRVKAWQDLKPFLEKLMTKAVERIRELVITQIKAFRSPQVNAQVLQHQKLTRFRDAFTFLTQQQPTLGEELLQAYINTMRWYYSHYFTRYHKSLATLNLHVMDKSDSVGNDDLRKAGGTSSSSASGGVLTGSKVHAPPHDTFNLGRRIEVVRSQNAMALSAFLAEDDKTYHYLEIPFRHFHLALIDNAASEYSFLASFFHPAFSHSHIAKAFHAIFDPVLSLGETFTKSIVTDSFDGLGILLCIRINQQFALELQRRKVPTMDQYINSINMLLWPRLQIILGHHCESVKKLTASLPTRTASTLTPPQDQSLAPHIVTQKFGQFLQGILELSTETSDDEPISQSVTRLGTEVESFLQRRSLVLGKDTRKRGRFLYNNYSLLLAIISDVGGKLANQQRAHFETLRDAAEKM